jgi:hypothetical protein
LYTEPVRAQRDRSDGINTAKYHLRIQIPETKVRSRVLLHPM